MSTEPDAEDDRTATIILRHRFVDVPGSEVGFCAGPYCAGGLISPETHAAHVAALLPAETDAGDVEALAGLIDGELPYGSAAERSDIEDAARAVLASDWLDAVRRKAADDRAEQIAQALEGAVLASDWLADERRKAADDRAEQIAQAYDRRARWADAAASRVWVGSNYTDEASMAWFVHRAGAFMLAARIARESR